MTSRVVNLKARKTSSKNLSHDPFAKLLPFPCFPMLCYKIQPQIIAIMTLFINLIKRKKNLCYLFIAVASRILRGDISNWFWLNRAPKSGGVAYNNGRVLSHGGNKVLIEGPVLGVIGCKSGRPHL